MIGIFEARPPLLRFERTPVKDIEATEREGRVMTKNVDVVHITQPPGKDSVTKNVEKWLRQLRDDLSAGRLNAYPHEWIDSFRRAYDNWLQGIDGNVPEGETSLREIPFVSPAEVENYAAIQIYTIEAAAAMTEDALRAAGMGSRGFRDKCRAYLENAKGNGKIAEENAQLRNQLEIARGEIEALKKIVDGLAEDKPRRGRPKKED